MNTASFPSEPEPFDFDRGPHPIRAINELGRQSLDHEDRIEELTRLVHSLQDRVSIVLSRIT